MSILPEWIDEIDEGGYRVADFKSEEFLEIQARWHALWKRDQENKTEWDNWKPIKDL